MARVFVHALGASAGGGDHYLRQLLGHIASTTEHEWIVGISSQSKHSKEFFKGNGRFLLFPTNQGAARRLYTDQVTLRKFLRRERIDVVLATGNFGLLRPPVPQILLNRNALYFSSLHTRRLWELGELRELARIHARRRLAIASMRSSRRLLVPTAAFGQTLRAWLPELRHDRMEVLPHGFDAKPFELSYWASPAADRQPTFETRAPRILLVSHYNYFRNFETLFHAVALLNRALPVPPELILTTTIGEGICDHRYDTSRAHRLLVDLGIRGQVQMLGTVPRADLPRAYHQADIVVCPSYVESFGHPLLEAMASRRPIVASDHEVHREICQQAALYFPTFDANKLAAAISKLLTDRELASRQTELGAERTRDYCWKSHFRRLEEIVGEESHAPSSLCRRSA